MEIDPKLIDKLPDPDAAVRFAEEFAHRDRAAASRLFRDEALASDVLAIAAFSPLLATTLLQNPEYVVWLAKRRKDSGVRSVGELLESLAQFEMTHSQLPPGSLYARFRRRELLRIFLRDIRRLATVPEITEEVSNLADAILAAALKLALNEVDKRFGRPQSPDDNGRIGPAKFCVVALGKLGSRELNYSSDIDLIFLYSDEGETSGNGSRGKVTNREYFVKAAETLVKLVGSGTGEGAAYRVDLRLRPHGRLGALAMSVSDTVRYYREEARTWERQVLIRSRPSAGDAELFRAFFAHVEHLVFSSDDSPATALASVRRSKEQIDREQAAGTGYNVKLGAGGIREIEFIAQALQLAHGGRDPWLRYPHTLVSLARLADRGFITETEHTGLSSAYDFLRRAEHILQMEHGLQTHIIPEDKDRRALIASKMGFASGGNFEADLKRHTSIVNRVFRRIFGDSAEPNASTRERPTGSVERIRAQVLASVAKSETRLDTSSEAGRVLERVSAVSPHFAATLMANPHLVSELREPESRPAGMYLDKLLDAVQRSSTYGARLAAMRRTWSRALLDIVVADVYRTITLSEAKRLQTELAEASIAAGLWTARQEVESKYRTPLRAAEDVPEIFPGLAVLALGKLGGRGVDYDSDLDLVMVYDADRASPSMGAEAQAFARGVEILVNVLSSMTREGSLYRVDLRLRPYGSKGLTAMSVQAFRSYMAETAVPWEYLAFVKLRGVGGDVTLARQIEVQTRETIHSRAAGIGAGELAAETRRVRRALEDTRTQALRQGEVDIKYGAGGMLDIYFAIRFLQLRDNVPDDTDDRSTAVAITRLSEVGTIPVDLASDIKAGYEFLAALDHNVRLTVGRTTRLPLGNQHAMQTIAERMSLGSPAEIVEQLTLHRLSIREAFEKLTS